MDLLVCSDLHLNYFNEDQIKDIGSSFARNPADGLIICGDISLSDSFSQCLTWLHKGYNKPIYFVLGNHDYWGSSFEEVDKLAAQFSNKDIVWLTQQDIILNENTILSGIDGWYDCVNNIEKVNKSIVMRDWLRIQDYICDRSHIDISKERSEKSYKLSDKIIKNQSAGYKNQIIVTHVPPFAQLVKEKQGYEAYYTSCDFGNVLTSSCTTLNKTICLSGHTHNKADYQIDNIHCYTMEACRGKPALSGVLNVDKMEFHFL